AAVALLRCASRASLWPSIPAVVSELDPVVGIHCATDEVGLEQPRRDVRPVAVERLDAVANTRHLVKQLATERLSLLDAHLLECGLAGERNPSERLQVRRDPGGDLGV